jgi:hypothetical protein
MQAEVFRRVWQAVSSRNEGTVVRTKIDCQEPRTDAPEDFASSDYEAGKSSREGDEA